MSDLSKIVNNDAEEIPEENSDSVAVPDAFQGDGKEREAKTTGVRTSCMNEFESEEKYSKNLDGEGQTRRDFVVMSALAVGCAGAAAAVVPFIRSMSPDAGVLAVGSTEVDISHMISGEIITVMWRGSPVFIFRRTPSDVEKAREVDISTLRDPELDQDRVKKGKDEWLVVVGVCTHLGCVPIGHKGDFGGWFCPCHGSDYDTSGRIRKGPAPKNLVIPEYDFMTDTKIKIG